MDIKINNSLQDSLLNKCRTCMHEFSIKRRRKPDKNQSICEVPNGSNNGKTIIEILLLIQPQIRVQMEDNLPKIVCSYCIEKLITIYDFIEMYRKSDKEFREILEVNENLVSSDEKSNNASNKIILEKVPEKPVETIPTSLYDLQIEELLTEDTLKDEESDWPEFDDDSDNELSEDNGNDNEDHGNDNESLFENPFSDDGDDEWVPESP